MALVRYVPPLLETITPQIGAYNTIIGINPTWSGSLNFTAVPNIPKKLEKRTRTKYVNEQKQILDSFGADCANIILSFLDPVSLINVCYTCKYFYNLRKSDNSDLSIYIHQHLCLKYDIAPLQLKELLERNDCVRSLKFIWQIATIDYRKNTKEYSEILEKLATNYNLFGSFNKACKICQYSSSDNFIGNYGIFTGGAYTFSRDLRYTPPVINSISLGVEYPAVPLEDGEIAMGSRDHPLVIIEQDGKSYLKIRVNERSALLPIKF